MRGEPQLVPATSRRVPARVTSSLDLLAPREFYFECFMQPGQGCGPGGRGISSTLDTSLGVGRLCRACPWCEQTSKGMYFATWLALMQLLLVDDF